MREDGSHGMLLVFRRLELEAETGMRIDECRDRLEGYEQALGHRIEREPDLEGGFCNAEIPELVLQHDRHLFGILLANA